MLFLLQLIGETAISPIQFRREEKQSHLKVKLILVTSIQSFTSNYTSILILNFQAYLTIEKHSNYQKTLTLHICKEN